MPNYSLSFVSQQYPYAANPPQLDKVVFTIDHIHTGGPGMYSTFDVVSYLVDRDIPVTVFIQCSDPVNLCPAERRNAQQLVNLNPALVSLGAHTLSPGNSKSAQQDNLNLIKDMISDITGSSPITMSYHGSGAGPEAGITYPGIQFARGIHSQWSTAQQDDVLNTPVIPLNTVNSALDFIRLRNLANLSGCLFVHSTELVSGSARKTVFDTILQAVLNNQLQALSYDAAMQHDYNIAPIDPTPSQPTTPTSPVPTPSSPCPLRHFSNNQVVQFLRINHRDGANGIYQVAQLQNFLNELGLDAGVADGIFGSRTKLSVIAYQILQGLSPDGVVGANTRASINAYCD